MLTCSNARAQVAPPDPARFPAAVVLFLDGEIPRMEAAVAARDREFFEGATERMVAFSEDWGFKAHANPALAPHAACTSAVSDYVVVGLCRLAPNSDMCDPELAKLFTSNLRQCRAAAAR